MRIQKTINFADVELKFSGDGSEGTFSGYASMFDGIDSYGDTIVKGAFVETLRTQGMPKMFFNHEWTLPIGKWTRAEEDSKGLWMQGEFTPGLKLADDVRAAMKHGTLDGLSIGGYLKKGDYEEQDGRRIIRKWSALMEVSPVAFPADSKARVNLATVKGMTDLEQAIAEVETIRDFEQLLRDAAGFSKGAAMALVARAKLVFGERDAQEDKSANEMAEVIERIERIAKLN